MYCKDIDDIDQMFDIVVGRADCPRTRSTKKRSSRISDYARYDGLGLSEILGELVSVYSVAPLQTFIPYSPKHDQCARSYGVPSACFILHIWYVFWWPTLPQVPVLIMF